MVAKQPRYFNLTLGYPHGTDDEYKNDFPEHIQQWHDAMPRATYVPLSNNYSSILDVDMLARKEGLPNYEKIENYITGSCQPRDVYLNYQTDIMIITESGAVS